MLAASADRAAMTTYDISSQVRREQPAAVCTETLSISELPAWLGRSLATVVEWLPSQRSHPAGPPFARYHRLDDGRFVVDAGFPVSAPVTGSDSVRGVTLSGGTVATTVHVGPYDQMAPGYRAVETWITAHGGEAVGDPWEVYLSDPGAQPDPATWRTEIVQPYRVAAEPVG